MELVIYIGLAAGVAFLASKEDGPESALAWFVASLFATPPVTFVALLVMGQMKVDQKARDGTLHD